MRTAARAPFHAVRSAMVATTVVTLAAAAHVVAGGLLPAPAVLFALLALTGLATTTATRLKLNFAAMSALLGAGQVVLHEAFSALSPPAAAAVTGGPAGRAHHGGAALLPLPADHLPLHQLDSALAWSMLAGHALATLACALLLSKGEDALWLGLQLDRDGAWSCGWLVRQDEATEWAIKAEGATPTKAAQALLAKLGPQSS